MWTDRAAVLDDVSAGDWIRPRLGRWTTVTGLLPGGFEAYARVLHPVVGALPDAPDDAPWAPLRWADVAAVTGRTLHPLVQWHRLVGGDGADPWNPDSALWPHGRPAEGHLALPQLTALCRALAPHTTTPDRCLMAVWEGWGALNGGSVRMTVVDGRVARTEPVPRAFTDAEWDAPRFRLPGRDYLLVAGPLDAVADVARGPGHGDGDGQSPALIWPQDRAWCVGTEVDHDSTLVGGTREAVAAVLAEPALEAFPVGPDDPLGFDGDTVNAPSDPPGAGRS